MGYVTIAIAYPYHWSIIGKPQVEYISINLNTLGWFGM